MNKRLRKRLALTILPLPAILATGTAEGQTGAGPATAHPSAPVAPSTMERGWLIPR